MSKSTEWWMTLFLFLVSSDICLSIQLYIESPNMLLLTLWKGIFICGSDCLFNSYWINSYTKMISLYELSNIWDPDNSCLRATINFRPNVRYLSIQSRVLDSLVRCVHCTLYRGVWLSGLLAGLVSDWHYQLHCRRLPLSSASGLDGQFTGHPNQPAPQKPWLEDFMIRCHVIGGKLLVRYFHLAFLSFCSTYLASITLHFWDPRPHIKYLLRVQSM